MPSRRLVMATTEKKEFLTRVDNTRFLVDFDGRYVTSTDTPSNAAHLDYSAADQWCQRLRKRGFPQAVVTDVFGNVMTYSQIKAALQAATEQAEPLPTSRKELDAIPSKEQLRRYRTEPAFKQRYDELEAQPRQAAGRKS
jgi:hypothetical protein